MVKAKAILCIDFDGTLIDTQVRIHPRDVDVLQDFPQGIQPVITTGRDSQSVKRIMHEHDLYVNIPFPLPGVFMNGGLICRPNAEVIQIHPFSQETRHAIIDLTQAYPHTAFTFFSKDAVDLVNPNAFGRHISNSHHLFAKETEPADLPAEIIKVMVLEPDPAAMDQIKQVSQKLAAEVAVSLPYAFEINPPGINKAASLVALQKNLHLEHLPIYAVGDAENDLALFQLAHTSFAPTDAHPKAVQSADHLIKREETGVLVPVLNHIRSL